jgi:hypothetical protein
MFNFFKKKPNAKSLDQNLIVQLGSEADLLNAKGSFADAILKYQTVIKTMNQVGVIETYFLGKAVLGILLAHVRAGEIQEAHAVWTSQMESKDSYGLGIYALEETGQQFEAKDTCLYLLICAYMHAFAGGAAGEEAVISYLNSVSKYAKDDNPAFKPIVINHWLIDTLILSQYQSPNRFTKAIESMYPHFGKADEAGILSLVKVSADSITFNQKRLHSYFPDQAAWQTGEAALEFHPDGNIKAV